MSTEPIEYNINHNVRVRLTGRGRKILRQTGPHDSKATPDADGWSEFQLWHLMETFGPHLYLGCEVPFNPDIVLIGDPIGNAFEAAVARSKGAEG
jgi:hypothetical protein